MTTEIETRKAQALDVLKDTADLLKQYAENHMKKEPPDVEKAKRNFDAHNKMLWAIIALSPAPDKWQTMETAPRDGTYIFVGFRSPDGYWNCDMTRWDGDGWWQHRQRNPTHWMPLPPPPTKSVG